jgi:murein DD-endopeptidase MepM/ murein hydrolase activator NlpD
MNSVLDHSMKLNASNYYPYGDLSSGGGDGQVTAFNGESVSGTPLGSDDTCIGGTIYLHPDWNPSTRMTNDSGCGTGYASYDEHPGYDYKASLGTPVYAAADGTVISTICYLGNTTSTGDCTTWGALAIRPTTATGGHDYFYQYLHMDTRISVVPGQSITAGQYLGTVGGRCGSGCSLPPHLHFEVRYIPTSIGAEAYPIVDPYGWVGGGTDPLYSRSVVTPANLWQ